MTADFYPTNYTTARDHPPGFSPRRAVDLMVKGETEAALEYVRAEVYREPCPVCRHPVTVLEGGRLAFHYGGPGIGVPCPGALPEAGAA